MIAAFVESRLGINTASAAIAIACIQKFFFSAAVFIRFCIDFH